VYNHQNVFENVVSLILFLVAGAIRRRSRRRRRRSLVLHYRVVQASAGNHVVIE
jgi:hypothetical protein